MATQSKPMPDDRDAADISTETELDRKIEEILNRYEKKDRNPGFTPKIPVSYRSKRLGVLAQPLPRPDVKIALRERKLVVKLLLLDHLINRSDADCMDIIVRLFYRDWPIAQIAIWLYNPPENDTIRDRHEKRVRDTVKHNLKSLGSALKTKFHITSFRQV
ncbi:MAG TPA: hypothetical protein VJQ82_17895 [Terriglobales bacterium]|nr:hypothetical protein [Terriglobales bacterium]